ncbi:MAG: hypothetical protein ABF542_10445, partial [Gluconobacter sp.]
VQCSGTCPAYNANYPTINNNRVTGIFYFDMNATYNLPVEKIGKMQLFLTVTNLANTSPILLPEGGLEADETYSNLLGRTYRGGIRMEF